MAEDLQTCHSAYDPKPYSRQTLYYIDPQGMGSQGGINLLMFEVLLS